MSEAEPTVEYIDHLRELVHDMDNTAQKALEAVEELRKARLAQPTLLENTKPIGYAGGKS